MFCASYFIAVKLCLFFIKCKKAITGSRFTAGCKSRLSKAALMTIKLCDDTNSEKRAFKPMLLSACFFRQNRNAETRAEQNRKQFCKTSPFMATFPLIDLVAVYNRKKVCLAST
jgi:hypothetical protein